MRLSLGNGPVLRTPEVSRGRAQAPGRKHHGLSGVGSGLENRVDAAEQLGRGSWARVALRRENHYRIAFVEIGQGPGWGVVEFLVHIWGRAGTTDQTASDPEHSTVTP